MRKLEARDVALVVALATVLVLLLLWFLGVDRQGRSVTEASGRGTDGLAVDAAPSFTISGHTTGRITPGVMLPLDLSLENPSDVALSIDRLAVSIDVIDAPRADADHPCTADDFEVREIGATVNPLRVEAKDAQRLSELNVVPRQRPALGMINRPVNQDGCKEATLTLTYQARGVEAR